MTNLFGLGNEGRHSDPPPPIGAKKLPVSASLLVDISGKVLWMDQSENYQHRSDPDRVIAALREYLD
ncbi:MAG: hypothetical protein P8J17_01995 [Halioglobus sp.]|nr:hypothetical protein [Halioglobus sp.]